MKSINKRPPQIRNLGKLYFTVHVKCVEMPVWKSFSPRYDILIKSIYYEY